jgi:hypothetical protein
MTKLSEKAPYKSLPHIYVMRGKGVEEIGLRDKMR